MFSTDATQTPRNSRVTGGAMADGSMRSLSAATRVDAIVSGRVCPLATIREPEAPTARLEAHAKRKIECRRERAFKICSRAESLLLVGRIVAICAAPCAIARCG